MKIGFTGTQDHPTKEQIEAFINLVKQGEGVWTQFHHGDCIGADAMAAHTVHGFFVPRRNFQLIGHPPEISTKRAHAPADMWWESKPYLERNKDIVACSDEVIALPKQDRNVKRSGTWFTIRYAWHCGKKVTIIFPDGTTGA